MARTKLIALRVDKEDLSIITSYCSKRSYLNRSEVINRILHAVLRCSDELTLHSIVEATFPYSTGYTVEFRKKVMPG